MDQSYSRFAAQPLSLLLPRARGVPLDVTKIYPTCPASGPSDPLIAADVVLRQEPDEDEDDEEDEGDDRQDEDDDDTDDGYSE